MSTSLPQVVLGLLAGISLIILLTTRLKVHAFFALILASLLVGLIVQIPVLQILNLVKEGFGNIMKSLGLVIVLGTTLGVLLEHTGSTRVMASFILKRVGDKSASLAMSITGFIVGLPIFCDSGYIVLSGLNKSIAARTGISVIIMSVSLATGLYSVHCLIPPHPGAAAAAGTIGLGYGKLILIGIIVALPAMIAGHLWARYAGGKLPVLKVEEEKEEEIAVQQQPSALRAFLPVIVPILLIALHSFVQAKEPAEWWKQLILILGEPAIALSIGVLFAFAAGSNWKSEKTGKLLTDAAEKAGGILVIIGAGGAFGAVLAATNIGQHFGEAVSLGSLGILFPFLLTSILKTAQGSSTVAIITASSVVLPLLPALNLDSENGRLLAVLSMGAGSMMISHANDAYFWVIAKFSGIDMKTMLRVYSVATIWMGIVSLLCVYLVSIFI
ncbi:MAG: GntP family permease [Chitinophagaceae bacterium]|nr:MAG: GntP family permease [Chitinophagaceae bacterium]